MRFRSDISQFTPPALRRRRTALSVSCPCLVFCPDFPENHVRCLSVCPDSVCLDSVRCPDSEKTLSVVCLSGRTKTRQGCQCPCPPTSASALLQLISDFTEVYWKFQRKLTENSDMSLVDPRNISTSYGQLNGSVYKM